MFTSTIKRKLRVYQILYFRKKGNLAKASKLLRSTADSSLSIQGPVNQAHQNQHYLLHAQILFEQLDVHNALANLQKLENPIDRTIRIGAAQTLLGIYSYLNDKQHVQEQVDVLIRLNPRSVYLQYRNIFCFYNLAELQSRFTDNLDQYDSNAVPYLKMALVRELLDRGEDQPALALFNSITGNNVEYYQYLHALILFSQDRLHECKKVLVAAAFAREDLAQKFWLYVHINIVQGNKTQVNTLFQIFRCLPGSRKYEGFYRRIAMLNQRHAEVFNCTRFSQAVLSLKNNLGKQYYNRLGVADLKNKRVMILPIWGMGDEMMVCGIYNHLNKIAIENKIELWFATEPRLYSLFSRSFPELNFKQVSRKHRGPFLDRLSDDELKNPLPDVNLYCALDHQSWRSRADFDAYIPLPLAVHEYLTHNGLVFSEPTLIADQGLKQSIKKQLGQISAKPKVGILWKSSLLTDARSIHYTHLKNWSPIFEMHAQCDFISLQNEVSKAESAQVKTEFGVKLHSIGDVDIHYDIEALSALISALDVVIAPSGLVSELASALGVRVIYMLNSAEGLWRKKPNNRDIWRNTMKIVTPDNYANKQSLIYNTAKELDNYLS